MDSDDKLVSIFGSAEEPGSDINKSHWTLDVAFSEDASRKRNNNAAQNYSILLKMALNLLKNEKRRNKEWQEKDLRDHINIRVVNYQFLIFVLWK